MTMPCLRAPIVLVHGLFGFHRLKLGPWLAFDYFHNIPRALTAAGNRVGTPGVCPTGGIAQRAGELKAFIDHHYPREPVHILAHSMGGLDARYMISRLQMSDRVLTLTTLGTPHRGSTFADWALGNFSLFVAPWFDFLNVSRKAFDDLTVANSKAFNADTPNAPGVRYFSVAGCYRPCWHNPAWHLSGPIVHKAEGPCDGVVSVASATWGESCEVWDGDHVSLVNWPQPGLLPADAGRLPQYAALLGRLRDEGF